MNSTLKFIINAVSVFTIIHIWYIGYLVFSKRGLYAGDLPEKGRELLDFYATHTLHGILNMVLCGIGMPCGSVFALLGMTKDIQSKSLWINFLNLSVILSGNCFLLNVHEWITSEKTV